MQPTDGLDVAANHKIIISNIKDGEVLSYSLALIKGHILTINTVDSPHSKCNLSLLHKHESSLLSTSEWPVKNSEFKLLLDLACGKNHLTFQYGDITLNLTVEFRKRKSAFHVTPVYIICKGHDGRFQAPPNEDNSIESACERIATGARLIQSLTAEKLAETNLGRKTFQLGCDISESLPQCLVFHSHLDMDRARAMEAADLWEHLGRELMLSSLGSECRKFLAFLSCTRYRASDTARPWQTHEEVLARTEAHVALGGGGLALFGTGCLHTWPARVEGVQQRFLDTTKVDTRQLMDDSCYRGTYGACFATTLGAVCHEVGHTFDLGHSEDGIMGRGFDDVDLVFSVPPISDDINRNVELVSTDVERHATISFTSTLDVCCTLASPIRRPRTSQRGSRPTMQCDMRVAAGNRRYNNVNQRNSINQPLKNNDDHTFWSNSCAVFLSFHRWFNNESPLSSPEVLKFEATRKLLTSKAGIRIVEIRDASGMVLHYWEFLRNRGRDVFILPSGPWYQPANTLVAEDSDGNVLKCDLLIGVPLLPP